MKDDLLTERTGFSINGYAIFAVLAVLQYLAVSGVVSSLKMIQFDFLLLAQVLFTLLVTVCWGGFFMVQPNQAKVMTLFGSYMGTVKETGLRWTIPLFLRKKISLRIRNFESGKLKVNDSHGNPIEIAAVIVWVVHDTAEAVFEVDDYESYVSIQSEAALRNMATRYPYDLHEDAEISLRSHPQKVAESLQSEVQQRLSRAGVVVVEARISHLAYAPEIASAMLQRQQASAIISARSKIVEGAVGMVEMALEKLSEKEIVQLDEERKAAMVGNLLVVLCGEQNTQPVLNAGSLY